MFNYKLSWKTLKQIHFIAALYYLEENHIKCDSFQLWFSSINDDNINSVSYWVVYVLADPTFRAPDIQLFLSKLNANPQPDPRTFFSFFAPDINRTHNVFYLLWYSVPLPPSVDSQCRDARLKKRFKTKENHMLRTHQGFICDKRRAGQQGQWSDSCAGHTVQISSQSCDFQNHMMSASLMLKPRPTANQV